MFDVELQMKVNEVKGLLKGMEDYIMKVRCNLASDNIHEVSEQLSYLTAIVERINEKTIEYKNSENDELM